MTTFGESAFENCAGLTGALVFADNAVVGNNAFKGCAGFAGDLDLSKVTIGEGTFENCTGLTGKLTLNTTAAEVPSRAFAGAGFTGELVIPDTVKTIKASAFAGCAGLTGELALVNVADIEASAFAGCTGLTGELVLPENCKSVGNSAFAGCTGLTAVKLPAGLSALESYAFLNTGINKVENKSSLTLDLKQNFGSSHWYHVEEQKPVDPEACYLTKGTVRKTISDIKVTAEKDTLELGEEMQVSVTTEAEGVDADMAAYTLSSSNDQVLTVDETGKVTAVGSGKAEIIATANFSTVKSSVEVTVAGEVVLDKPVVMAEASKENVSEVNLTWNAVDGADAYIVYAQNGEGWVELGRVAATAEQAEYVYTVKDLQPGTKYTYSVEAYSKVGDTEYFSGKSDAVSAVTNLAQPALVSAKPVSATQIRVDWNPVENAQGYRIYRKEAGSSEWVMVRRIAGENKHFCIDSTAEAGKEYTYTVTATCSVDGEFYQSTYDETGVSAQTVAMAEPTIVSVGAASNVTTALRVTWNPVENADGYIIYRKGANDTEWTRIKKVMGQATDHYSNIKLEPGTKYTYCVQSFVKKDGVVYYSEKGNNAVSAVTHLKTPALKSATAVSNGVKVVWSPVENAQGYRIYRKEAGSGWKLVRRIAGENKSFCIDSTAEAGKTYTYTVRATCSWDGKLYLSKYDTKGITVK